MEWKRESVGQDKNLSGLPANWNALDCAVSHDAACNERQSRPGQGASGADPTRRAARRPQRRARQHEPLKAGVSSGSGLGPLHRVTSCTVTESPARPRLDRRRIHRSVWRERRSGEGEFPDQARAGAEIAAARRRRRAAKPTAPRPTSIRAQAPGSGAEALNDRVLGPTMYRVSPGGEVGQM